MRKLLDRYIIGKFIGTYFFTVMILLVIAVIIDLSEKIDKLLTNEAPVNEIISDYYLNFILYYGNMFSPLVVFIAAIWFTSKMASDTEIVAIMSSGVSFDRLLYPYFIGATILMSLSLTLNHWVVPKANVGRLAFESKYISKKKQSRFQNIHKQVLPGEFIFLDSWRPDRQNGERFTYEKFDENMQMVYKLRSDYINYSEEDSVYTLQNYYVREIAEDGNEVLSHGFKMDTTFIFKPSELVVEDKVAETKNFTELNEFIEQERFRGSDNINTYLVERHKRTSLPMSTYILTLIAVCVSSRKKRGGMGMDIALGLVLMFTYVFFMQIANTFAVKGNFNPLLAVWTPNIIYGILAAYLYVNAKK